jgi:hypothetical protein
VAESYAAALEERSRHQVGARIARRWGDRGYVHAFTLGQIHKPVGVLSAMLARPECPNSRCEDGFNVDSGAPCPRCSERIADRRAAAEACPDPDCVDGVNSLTDGVCVHCNDWAREVVERRAAGDVPPNPFLADTADTAAAAAADSGPRVPDQRGPADEAGSAGRNGTTVAGQAGAALPDDSDEYRRAREALAQAVRGGA